MNDHILGDRGKALEDMFFAKESEKLREAMREKEEAKNKKEALSAASGAAGVLRDRRKLPGSVRSVRPDVA